MQNKKKFYSMKKLYIIFFSSVLFINFFLITSLKASVFKVSDIEITEPFELNFNREQVIDKGFRRAFIQLISTLVNSQDKEKIKNSSLRTIKTLIDSFTISDEKFINDEYKSKFHVNFNKKNTLNFLEQKNIFPSMPKKKELLIIPILIDVQEDKISLFSENIFYNNWNNKIENFYLLNYLLLNEDLEDLNSITQNRDIIEEYDFKKIIQKYDIDDFIITIIFKNKDEIRVLSKISFDGLSKIKNIEFKNIDFESEKHIEDILTELKITYENYWKEINKINTSIKLPLTISVNSKSVNKIENLENILSKMDLVSSYNILKFDSNNIFFKIIYNGSPKKFLQEMMKNEINIDTQRQIWRVG